MINKFIFFIILISIRNFKLCGFLSKFKGINDKLSFLKNNLSKTSYRDYYLSYVEKNISENPEWKSNIEKSYQLDFLKSQGLQPNMKFLDYGCGPLSAGIYFVEYLEPNKYVGVDISKKVLEIANKRVQKFGIEKKFPEIIQLKENSFQILSRYVFDFIWSNGVFSHTPPHDTKKIVKNLINLLHKNSIFLFSFGLAEEKTYQRNFKSWRYDLKFFENIALENNLKMEHIKEWTNLENHCETHSNVIKYTIKV